MDDFDLEWDRLAELGACDGRGGAEYQRVRAEWDDYERPADLGAFIRWRANVSLSELLQNG